MQFSEVVQEVAVPRRLLYGHLHSVLWPDLAVAVVVELRLQMQRLPAVLGRLEYLGAVRQVP